MEPIETREEAPTRVNPYIERVKQFKVVIIAVLSIGMLVYFAIATLTSNDHTVSEKIERLTHIISQIASTSISIGRISSASNHTA
jgi:hypothetical protein